MGRSFSDFLGRGRRRVFNPYLGWRLGYARFEAHSEFAFAGVTGFEMVRTRAFSVDAAGRLFGLLGKSDPMAGTVSWRESVFYPNRRRRPRWTVFAQDPGAATKASCYGGGTSFPLCGRGGMGSGISFLARPLSRSVPRRNRGFVDVISRSCEVAPNPWHAPRALSCQFGSARADPTA